MHFIIIFSLLLLLFFTTRLLTRSISSLTHHLTRSRYASVAILSLLLYPGTVVHELAHLVTALVLFVPIEKLELEPKMEKGYIRAGSVTTHATDWVRQTLISISPLPVGIFMLWFIQEKFLNIHFSTIQFNEISNSLPSYPILIASLFALFSISSSMFPSKTDIQLSGTVPIMFVTGISIVLYVLFQPPLNPLSYILIIPLMLHIFALFAVFVIKVVV